MFPGEPQVIGDLARPNAEGPARAGGLASLVLVLAGCASTLTVPEYAEVDRFAAETEKRPPATIRPDEPLAVALDPVPSPAALAGPQPVEAYIGWALNANRGVAAARANLAAMRERVPQALALEDPMLRTTTWPVPKLAPQYSIMGMMVSDVMLTQRFPWFGTLRLRGEAAAQDARAALHELAAAQLEAVVAVKRAYAELHYVERAEAIVRENRALAADFVEVAALRYRAGNTTQQDVLRAEVAVDELDGQLVEIGRERADARAALARVLHIGPEAELATLPELPLADAPAQADLLYRMAAAARPDLQARLAEVSRDRREVELARKRFYPDVDAGLVYWWMNKSGAESPTAMGMDNLGFTVGVNLPVYRKKLVAGLREAQARAVADARRYEDLRDQTYAEVKQALADVRARRELIDLVGGRILPRSEQALEVAAADYRAGDQDFVTLLTAWREVLQVRLQLARLEADLFRAVAELERAVGVQLQSHQAPPDPPPGEAAPAPEPPDPEAPGPFSTGDA